MIDALKIAKWISERLEQTPISQTFALFHNTEMMGPDLVTREFVKTAKGELQQEADRIAEACFAAAQNHAGAFQGKQRFKLVAEGEHERALGQLAFQLGPSDTGMALALTGGPGDDAMMSDMGGGAMGVLVKLIGQQMRHTEVMTRLAIDSHTHLAGENASLRSQRDRQEERRLEVFEQTEELASKKHERDLELIELTAAQERKNKAIGMLAEYMPEVAKRLFTRPMFETPALASAESGSGEMSVSDAQRILRELFKKLDREPIYDLLDTGDKAVLDSLLGIGDDPQSLYEFRKNLVNLWKKLPDELTNGIAERAIESPYAIPFVELLKVEDA